MAVHLDDSWKAHARRLRNNGKTWDWISNELTSYYGLPITIKRIRNACADVKKPKKGRRPRVTGKATGARRDLTEAWLAGRAVMLPDVTTKGQPLKTYQGGDLEYRQRCRSTIDHAGWTVSTQDQLARASVSLSEQHERTRAKEDSRDSGPEQWRTTPAKVASRNAKLRATDWAWRPAGYQLRGYCECTRDCRCDVHKQQRAEKTPLLMRRRFPPPR